MEFELNLRHRYRRFITPTLACVVLTAIAPGCRAFRNSDGNPWSSAPPKSDIQLVSGEEPLDEEPTASVKVMDYLTGNAGRGTAIGREYYQEADELFKQASAQDKDKAATADFYKASKLFAKAAKATPGSALEQDALFMQGESLFFANRLNDATDVYQTLQKEHPRSRHNDTVAARLFAISRYWIEASRANNDTWFKVNLTDEKRPAYDAKGHAIRVLDQIRYDDPTGRLADDATMAAAVEYIRQGEFEKADEFLTDLRETFTDSDHMFMAHLLGIQAKLEVYAGPTYSGLVLQEAETLVKQTRQRFPNEMRNREYSDMVARAAAEIAVKRADRLVYRAEYREKRAEYGAAREYYQRVLKDYSNTPTAKTARERLELIADYPAVPKKPLKFMESIFPDQRQDSPPLVLKSETPVVAAVPDDEGNVNR